MSAETTLKRCACLLALSALTMALVASTACADPKSEYMEFRFHAGVPGNQSGVTPMGRVGAAGAVQMAIPVAYTPAKDNYVIDANTGMQGDGLKFAYKDADANGSLNFGLGLLEPGHGLYVSYMATSIDWEPVWAIQYQVIGNPSEDDIYDEGDTLAVAVGGIDLNNQRAANVSAPFEGDSRSFYIVATERFGSEDKPLYATLGIGTDRYEGLFGGVCYRPSDRMAVFAEYDSIGINGGLTYALKDAESRDNWILFFGIADADPDYLSYGISYTFGAN